MQRGFLIRGAWLDTLPLVLAPVVAASMTMWNTVFRGVYGGSYMHRPCPVVGGRPAYPVGDYGQCLTSYGWYIAVTLLCAGVAVSLQLAINFADMYFNGTHQRGRADVRAHTDVRDASRFGPLGGSSRHVLAASAVSVALVCAFGVVIVVLTGHWWLIMLAVLCMAAGWFYVGGRHPYGDNVWGEVSLVAFLGLVATCGTSYVLSDEVPFLVMWVGVALGFAAVAALSIGGLPLKDDPGNGLRATRGDARGHVVEGTGTWLPRLGERWSRRFTETTMALSIVMLALSFIEFNPWMQSSSLAQTACGLSYSSASDRVGKTVCNYATVAFAQRMAVVSTALLVISGVLWCCLVVAIHRERYRTASRFCTATVLTVAFCFGTLYLVP